MIRAAAFALAGLLLVACSDPHEVRIGDVSLQAPWLRATAPGASVGAGYVALRNTGDRDDRLLEITGAAATRIEVHQMHAVDGVMRMRKIGDGLPIPVGAAVALEPGGYHLMLIGLQQPLTVGERHVLQFRFEHAGTVDVPFEVRATDAVDGHAHH